MARQKTNRIALGDQGSHTFTFEQLEMALESAIGMENDETSLLSKESTINGDNNVCGREKRREHHHHHHHGRSGVGQANSNQHGPSRSQQQTQHQCNLNVHAHGHHHHHSHNTNHNHNHNQHHHHQASGNSRTQSVSVSHNHCNEQDISNEDNYTIDQTEFEQIWRELSGDKDRYNFLKSLYHAASPSGNLIFAEVSFGSLGDMASALSEFDDNCDDFLFVVYMLHSLSRAKRFSLSLQFLTCEERVECKKLFHKLWRSMSDKQQDLAENGITELTINDLMKIYEIDMYN